MLFAERQAHCGNSVLRVTIAHAKNAPVFQLFIRPISPVAAAFFRRVQIAAIRVCRTGAEGGGKNGKEEEGDKKFHGADGNKIVHSCQLPCRF